MTEYQKVVDFEGKELQRSMYVFIESLTKKQKVLIDNITDFDVDYNDDTQRAEMNCPVVTIVYPSGEQEKLSTFLKDRKYNGPNEAEFFTFECEEIWIG